MGGKGVEWGEWGIIINRSGNHFQNGRTMGEQWDEICLDGYCCPVVNQLIPQRLSQCELQW